MSHTYGAKNIRRFVDQHDGNMEKEENGVYRVTVHSYCL